MYAVVATGGKQIRMDVGRRYRVERLSADVGETVTFDQVLLAYDGTTHQVGQPTVQGTTVEGEVVAHGRHPKIKIIKFKRRKHHMKRQGHRQHFTEVLVKGIQSSKRKASAASKKKAATSDDA